MDVFNLRERLVADYQSYTRSFIKIRDARIAEYVDNALNAGAFWPEPLLQLNPTFLAGGTIDDLVQNGLLHPHCAHIYRPYDTVVPTELPGVACHFDNSQTNRSD
jgi:hypothetical protein